MVTMGRYIEWDDIAARYHDVSHDFDNPETQDGFIDGAEADVDSRLGIVYAVPFATPPPPIVKDICIDMAYYRMTWRSDGAKALREFIDDRITGIVEGLSAVIADDGTVLVPIGDAGGGGALVPAWTDRDHRPTFGPEPIEESTIATEWLDERRSYRDGY